MAVEMSMEIGSQIGIAYTHGVDNGVDVVDLGGEQALAVVHDTAEQVMVGRHLVAQPEDELLTTGIAVGYALEHVGIGSHVDRIVGRLSQEGNTRKSRGQFPLSGIAEDDGGILHQAGQHLGSLSPIVPQVFTVVDVTGDGQSHLVGNAYRLEGGIGSRL